ISLSCRRAARRDVEADRLQDQAVERVQDVQDLREDLRVGRHPRARDRAYRVRPVRRLRTPLHGSAEVPALDHPAEETGIEAGAGGRQSYIAASKTRTKIT